MTKLLFICSRNQVRSLTAERLFANSTQFQARSAGTQPQARVRVTAGMLGWADLIFVMERGHQRRLEERFPDGLVGKTLICLHLPDEYCFGDPELTEVLESRLRTHLSEWAP